MGEVDPSVKRIVQRIREDSETQRKEILAEAQKKADEILAEAQKKAEALRRGILTKGSRETEMEKQRIIANAKLRERKLLLDAKEEAIQEAFGKAEERLRQARSEKEYSDALKRVIGEAIRSLGGGEVEVLTREDDAQRLKNGLLDEISRELKAELKAPLQITLSEETIETMGGAIVRSRNGKVEVDNTFETRLERSREDLRAKVSKILFQVSS
jgi:V/A-type H+-transporting ATPase subunit E